MDAIDERLVLGARRVSAAATLARIMNSSISRCASSRCGMMTRSTMPSDFSTILRSGFKVERASFVAGVAHGAVGGVERRQDFFHERLGDLVGPAADRELRLLVTEPRGGADHDAMKRMRTFAAVGADHHAHRERRAIFVGPQRTQIVGDALRQHRHHAVGEIDRIAAFDRSAVERRAGPHIMRHVGDRDGHHMAARVFTGE